MGSNSETARVLNYPIVKQGNLHSLRECADLLPTIQRNSFNATYGNILKLLQLEVQTEAIAALSQFYDSSLRCFAFKDFQLAPTLEEYARILGFSLQDIRPYQYLGHHYKEEKLASLLQIKKEDLLMNKQGRSGIEGFSQKYLERKMQLFAHHRNWAPVKEMLALTIFGTVLFPRIEGYVDATAISVFLAFRDTKSPINPVPAILADTYSTFTHHSEREGKKILCCLPALYVWLVTHTFIISARPKCPILDSRLCDVGVMNVHEWLRMLAELTDRRVRWFPSWWQDNKPEVIVQCGGFQNVPLMGTRGYINYNPFLALRQLGYPMRNAPTNDMLTPLYFSEGDQKDVGMLRRVSQAWNKVICGGRELTKSIGDKETTFRQWLQERLQKTQLPYQSAIWVEEEVPEPPLPTYEGLETLRSALSKSEEDKKSIQEELERILVENRLLKEENLLKGKEVESRKRKLKVEEEGKREVQVYLKSAKEELKRCNCKLDKATREAQEWKKKWEESEITEKNTYSFLQRSKRESRIVIAGFEEEVESLKQEREKLEDILKSYQQALRKEQERTEGLKDHIDYQEAVYRQLEDESAHWEKQFKELVRNLENHQVFIELKNEGLYWKDRFSKLAWLANQAVRDIPRHLKKADASMHPLNTPTEVFNFVEFCKVLIAELREEIGPPTKKKREESGKMKSICI